MYRILLVLLVMSGCAIASGQESYDTPIAEKLKRENPERLFYWLSIDEECPVVKTDIEKMTAGIFVRSRLQQPSFASWYILPNQFELRTVVDCNDNDGVILYYIMTRFREKVTVRKSDGPLRVRMDHIEDYGSSGMLYDPDYGRADSRDTVRNAIRESVEDAITDYLKANFNP